MKNVILVHGWVDREEFYDPKYPTASNSHWFPWLTKRLMMQDIYTVAPEMPAGYYPEYRVWKKEFERFDINSETILVGHSCGAGFLIRWLSEKSDRKVGKVILVAPWMGIRFNDEPFDDTFFDFEPRHNIGEQTDGLHIFHSTDDSSVVQDSVDIIRQKVDNIQYREFSDKGHFTLGSLGSEQFPELLAELVKS